MKIQISLVDLVDATTKGGKPYQVVEVTYKNLSFQGKVESRKIMPFGDTAETAKTLRTATKGDLFEIKVVKNAAGYNDWVSATPAGEGAPEAAPAPRAAASGGFTPATQVAKSTYETPEERAKKQVLIVRQSSLSNAIDFLKISSSDNLVVDDVLKVARQFENYVFDINTKITSPTNELDTEEDLPIWINQ